MSDCLPGHVAMDSSKECSACMSQLHRTDLLVTHMGVLEFYRVFMVVFAYHIFRFGPVS